MNRRAFLGLTAAAIAGYALDPERLLWVPGAKTIFLPPDKTLVAAQADELACLLAGAGGPFLVGSRGVGHRRTSPWAVPASAESLMRSLSDQEYRLLVDRGRQILEHRKTVVAPTPALVAHISREDALRRWGSASTDFTQHTLNDRPWNPDWQG